MRIDEFLERLERPGLMLGQDAEPSDSKGSGEEDNQHRRHAGSSVAILVRKGESGKKGFVERNTHAETQESKIVGVGL